MGKGVREKPERLAEKLRQIRVTLGLSQSEMVRRLGLEETISYTKISHYETGIREPSLLTLLKYAEAANVYLDVLVNDALDLPDNMPSRKKHEGLMRAALGKRRR